MKDKVILAAELYLLRQPMIDRWHQWDKEDVWDKTYPEISARPTTRSAYEDFYPDNKEYRTCCDSVVASHYDALFKHCCTAKHIANLLGVDRTELLRTARQLRVLQALEQA